MPFSMPQTPMDMGLETVFSGNTLDRVDQIRLDDEKVMALWTAPNARLMVLNEELKLLSTEAGNVRWLNVHDMLINDHAPRMLLGVDRAGVPHFAVVAAGEMNAEHFNAKFRDLRSCAMKGTATPEDLARAAHAKAVLDWHMRHGHCAVCGAKTTAKLAGHERNCTSCGATHYPRTDPVVIMLAVNGDKALVGRNPKLPPGVYTALAGFVETGERIEEAVARELYEEAGVRTTGVQYVASQPWPWPSSLMIGCLAEVDGTDLMLDETEIEDAFWITKDDAKKAITDSHPDFQIPPRLAIARQLIEVWATT